MTCAFFGDGTANNGAFYESMNMASLYKLPIIYVVENNLWAIGMYHPRATAPSLGDSKPHIWKKGEPFGMPGVLVDGMDVVKARPPGSIPPAMQSRICDRFSPGLSRWLIGQTDCAPGCSTYIPPWPHMQSRRAARAGGAFAPSARAANGSPALIPPDPQTAPRFPSRSARLLRRPLLAPAAVTARPSSRPRPTASAATPLPTRMSSAPRRRRSSSPRGTPSRCVWLKLSPCFLVGGGRSCRCVSAAGFLATSPVSSGVAERAAAASAETAPINAVAVARLGVLRAASECAA